MCGCSTLLLLLLGAAAGRNRRRHAVFIIWVEAESRKRDLLLCGGLDPAKRWNDNHDDVVDDDDDIDPREDINDMGESEEESDDDDNESDDEEIEFDDDSSEGDDDRSGNDDDSSSNDDEIDNKIVETFILSFHNGDYDVEFDDALSYDRGVTSMVRPTQTFYNKPENWRERNRIGLEKVKRELNIVSVR
jgi:hypothetical protein